MQKFAGRVAFANANITYADLLCYAESKTEHKNLCLCIGKTREEQAIEIVRCIASGNVAVPLSREYGDKNFEYIQQTVKTASDNVDDLALLMFTSGTTGTPKGVMLTDENIITNLKYISTYFRVDNCRNVCIGRPLVHIAVLTGELLYALCNGLTIYFYEEPFMPKRLLSYMKRYEIDMYCATPTLYQALAKADKNHECPIKVGAISGEILSESVGRTIAAAFPNTEFYNVYGLTEHSPRVSALLPNEFATRPHSIGKPIADVNARIVDGELLINSPCIMKGYFRDNKQTAEKLKGGWLHTGDMAHIDSDGYLYIDGRKDNMIIHSGLNVYPEEIELAVKECSDIDDCLVYGEVTENGTVICLKYIGEIEATALRKKLVRLINPNIVPNKIERVEEIARTASGKKIRK
ncbi:MAG: long-chain fatty acid--CoA ligase [Clostridiales bacterium]|nr:long-chain fatty acid--CoA ligase [Clostridiales bacterium]